MERHKILASSGPRFRPAGSAPRRAPPPTRTLLPRDPESSRNRDPSRSRGAVPRPRFTVFQPFPSYSPGCWNRCRRQHVGRQRSPSPDRVARKGEGRVKGSVGERFATGIQRFSTLPHPFSRMVGKAPEREKWRRRSPTDRRIRRKGEGRVKIRGTGEGDRRRVSRPAWVYPSATLFRVFSRTVGKVSRRGSRPRPESHSCRVGTER